MKHEHMPYDPSDELSDFPNFIRLERREQPISPMPKSPGPSGDGGGPKRPDPESAQKDNLLKRMRKVDPKQAERYRQRTGE